MLLGESAAVFPGNSLTWGSCQTRMNPGFPANSPIFSSPALGQLGVGPLSHGCAVPALPKGEPSRCATGSLQKGQSRLPLWGRCPPVGGRRGQLPHRPGKAGRSPCFPSFLSCAARLVRSRARSQPFEKGCTENFYARSARLLARTCVFLLHRRGVQPPPPGAN